MTTSNNNIKKIIPIYRDLKDDFNLGLLERFYNELMKKNFPKEEELEPLENWIEMFEENDMDSEDEIDGANGSKESNTADEEYRVLFYPKFGEDEYQVDFHVVLALCPEESKQEMIKNGLSDIMGGVVFEYYPNGNFGCITYLLVNDEYRGQGIASLLMKRAVSSLDEDAKSHGHLGGINAIFLETNSADRVTPEEDVMAPAQRHIIFHRLGIRLLDFDYVQPPLALEHGKCRDLLLTCVLTPNIPSDVYGSEQRYYLPSQLLRKFLEVFWGSCCERLEMGNWREDIDFRRMMDQLDRSEKIPMLDLPWTRPWTIVDVNDSTPNYEQLVTRFYHEVLTPNFSGENELDSLDSWLSMLSRSSSISQTQQVQQRDFHLLVALRYANDDITSQALICGGLVFEYHAEVNCGLISYILVGDGPLKSETMARSLIQRAVDILDRNAVEYGNLAGCNAIFLETAHQNQNHTATTDDKILENSYRHEWLDKMGWRKVDFSYSQPPLSKDKKPSRSLSLVVLVTKRIPQLQPDSHYLPASLLLDFTTEYWRQYCSLAGYSFEDDLDYKHMISSLSKRERIPLLHIPWSRPFSFIDLSIDYHEDLLVEYCNAIGSSLVDIRVWRQQLQQTKKYLKIEDFHLLLAICYNQDRTTEIVGGVSFSYFHNGNCGLIRDLFIKESSLIGSDDTENGSKQSISQFKGWDIAKELLNKAVDTLNSHSLTRTHIVGPNAIFFETMNDVNSNSNNINSSNNSCTLKSISFNQKLENQKWFKLDIPNYVSPKYHYYDESTNEKSDINLNSTLSILLTPKLPLITIVPTSTTSFLEQYMPIEIIKTFLGQYWASVVLRNLELQNPLKNSTRRLSNSKRQIIIRDENYKSIIDSLKSKERIHLLLSNIQELNNNQVNTK